MYDRKGGLLGVTAVDVRMSAMFDLVDYYKRGEYSYAFIVTNDGRNFVSC